MSNVATPSEIMKIVADKLNEHGDKVLDMHMQDGRGQGEFIPKGSSRPTNFEFNTTCVRNQHEVNSNWNPSYAITDEGEVIDENGDSVGWIKILKQHPSECIRLYDKDNITISIPKMGNKTYAFNSTNMKDIVKDLAFAAKVTPKDKK